MTPRAQSLLNWLVPSVLLVVLLLLVAGKFRTTPGNRPAQAPSPDPKSARSPRPHTVDRPITIDRPPRDPWVWDEHTQDLIDAGLLSGSREPRPWALLDSSHQLTEQAVKALGLDADTRAGVQKHFDRFYEQQAQAFARRVTEVSHLSDPERGIRVFDVPATPDRGVEARTQLRSSLESLAGLDAAARMMRALPTSALSYCGRLDVRIQLYPNPVQDAPAQQKQFAHLQTVDPRTGRPVSAYSRCSSDRLGRTFGIDFEFLNKIPQ